MFDKLYRKSTINRINKKYKLLGYDKKNKATIFLNCRLITTILVFILFMLNSDKGYIYGPIVSILLYISFEYVLDNKIKKRANKLNYEAIFYFQVLALTLEAGKNLQGGIELASKSIDNELSQEFIKTLNEVKMGQSLTQSLTNMKSRIPSEEINTVLLNITQSQIFGNNIIDSLNNQIDYLRDKKLLNIKGKINKMPVKISVISVIFIIPIVLLLILGPVVINLLINT